MSATRLVLLTGIPATGKTTLGNHLRDDHGFVHLDFEGPSLFEYLERGLRVIDAKVELLVTSGSDVVITWGFAPVEHLPAVLALRAHGFEWFWLDGSRRAARRAFRRRGTVPMQALDRQMRLVAEHLDPRLGELAPRLLDPFGRWGRYRPVAELAAVVLARCAGPDPGETGDADAVDTLES